MRIRTSRQPRRVASGADDQDRTGDLVLTKDALCQLSYIGLRCFVARSDGRPPHSASADIRATAGLPSRSSLAVSGVRRLERETGIEPATNSLEGCDSTTELLPPSRSLTPRSRFGGHARLTRLSRFVHVGE